MQVRPPRDHRPVQIRFGHLAAVLVACVACVFGITLAYSEVVTDPASHIEILSRLSIPDSWTLADSNVQKDALLGSRVERYYSVDADPDQLVEPIREMLLAAAFTLDPHFYPFDWCTWVLVGDTPPPNPTLGPCPSRVMDPCSRNGPGGPMTCSLDATVGRDRITVDVFDRGRGINYYVGSDDHVVNPPGLAVIRVVDAY